MNPLSITSNETKLLGHLDVLRGWQRREHAGPIQLCVAPTNRCQHACEHCCFRDRDRSLELDFPTLWGAVRRFRSLGGRSVEFTGGGEPTLYSALMAAVYHCDQLGLPVGLNTNGWHLDGVRWERFAWVRLSANTWTIQRAQQIAAQAQRVSACFVAGPETGFAEIREVCHQAAQLAIPLRIAPDCQLPLTALRELVTRLLDFHARLGPQEQSFVSDFNTPLDPRADDRCWMHLVKPLLWPDGWVYACPSFELSLENGSDVSEPFRVCRAEEIESFYGDPERALVPRHHDCSFCKYTAQNALISAIMTEVDFAEFV